MYCLPGYLPFTIKLTPLEFALSEDTNGSPPIDTIRLMVKSRVTKDCQEKLEMQFPILAPHVLADWLLQSGRLSLDAESARRYWMQHRERETPFMLGQNFVFERCFPFAIYGDAAEYTATGQKILVIFRRYVDIQSVCILGSGVLGFLSPKLN